MDSQGRVALQMAIIWGGKLDVAKLLLDRGAMVGAKDNLDSAPLAVAAFLGKLEVVELFLDHGAVIDATDSRGETALYNASLRNHSGVIAELAARGANLDFQNIDGMSAFFKAASTLKTDTMDILTKCGADTDARDNNGCTALARATMANNMPLITHLLQLGVDIDAEDNDGWTPLFVAMIHNEENLIRLLLTYRSNMEMTDNHGNTALHQAAILGATLVVRYILALNPFNSHNHSQLNLFGETPLALASKHDRSPIVKVLLKHGANPHHVDPNGHRALDRAMYWGSFACVRLLLKAGASVDSTALIALQQGKLDNCGDARKYNMIFSWLQSQYPQSVLPTATKSPQLADHFARTISHNDLRRRMHEKQGKPNLVLDPFKDRKSGEEAASSDPFEACIPKTPPSQIINNSTMNIKVNESSALEIGEIGTNLALGITNTVLGL
ncbi:ankyrin repeat-containing domain protein [Bisporella sp. PMI_857]|nr:ankyrin repeat-containing domain protein [Bisporella sp. PMI_857]